MTTILMTKKEVIVEIGFDAYKRAVETKQLTVITFSEGKNAKQKIERTELMAFIRSRKPVHS